ncbi:hypothetical protein AQJ58_39825 [Streptomyces sp. DSM 15324]|nr:hypothetical protein AQJ58_39825 [Streptomyces sp. DSM 15324]
MRFAQCRSAWAVVLQVTAGAGMPTNSGILVLNELGIDDAVAGVSTAPTSARQECAHRGELMRLQARRGAPW